MTHRKTHALFAVLSFLLFNQVWGQPGEENLINNFKQHIATLASDEFEGRETGTAGEKLSYEYIIKKFSEMGLTPKDETGDYLQPFEFTTGFTFGENNRLVINGKSLDLEFDYYPLPHSSNSSTRGELIYTGYGMIAKDINHDDYKELSDIQGKIFVMELSTPPGTHSHSEYAGYSGLMERINLAVEKGASGVIFINSDSNISDPDLKAHLKITRSEIPVVYIKKDYYEEVQNSFGTMAEVTVEVIKLKSFGNNVIGFIDNHTTKTVVIGAHYDHLGFGDESSLYRGIVPLVHNGADDNASGTAMVIELAKYCKTASFKKNNYLFIAFSGEEKGLLGSNFYVKNPTVRLENINYMINMDMVGRIDTADKKLIINGTGTSPVWKEELKNLKIKELNFVTTESGIGPSDHTSFYLNDIPVLHLFSGTHEDYHKPSDDEDKINYEGMVSIYNFLTTIIKDLDNKKKLEFVKTKDADNANAPKFSVTLGVVPDYAYEGTGMRIDGVSEEKSASRAGLLKGDVVIQMGENKVFDMMSYMEALGKFKKGDKIKLKALRGDQEKVFDVEF